MANSSLVSNLKNAVIAELLKDEAIFDAIDSPDITNPEDADELLYKHIFPYHKSPEALTGAVTLLTVQVQIPKTYDQNNLWVVPRLEIWIISHETHMTVDNIPDISDNRNDYLSRLIDRKFNGRDTFGVNPDEKNNIHLYGNLELVGNTEGVFSEDYLFRQMLFEMKDINNGLCPDR
ncbi:MAG: hypothetical protein ACI39R_06915 [Lachnospiraceae bacterium]